MSAKALKPRTEERPLPTDEQMRAWISEAAYYRAESRGFEPGAEMDDWLAAEAELTERARAR
jgi:hypothetical protein